MCTENLFFAANHVVAVIFHQGCATFEAIAHDFCQANEKSCLPIAFGTETVTVSHQTLNSKAWELLEPAEIFECIGECASFFFFEEGTQGNFLLGCIAQGIVAFSALTQFFYDVILFFVFVDECINFAVFDRFDAGNKIVDAPGVDGDAETNFSFCFIAFCYGDVAHVVPKADNSQVLCFVPSGCSTCPYAYFAMDFFIGVVTNSGGAWNAHAGEDVAEFAISVSCLVQVHEVHIHGCPRHFTIDLGVEVKEWLAHCF